MDSSIASSSLLSFSDSPGLPFNINDKKARLSNILAVEETLTKTFDSVEIIVDASAHREAYIHIGFYDKSNLGIYRNFSRDITGKLGITHSVLYDEDVDEDIHKIVNDFITSNRNDNTKKIYTFDSDFEKFLQIKKVSRNDLKPLNVLKRLKDSEISSDKLAELRNTFDELCLF